MFKNRNIYSMVFMYLINMVKLYTASEIEKKVLEHINRKTSKGYTIDFNPLDLSVEGIADELNIDTDEVEESIERLLGNDSDNSNKSLERIESIKLRLEIWLPFTKGGTDIKNALCESGLAVKGNLNILYSFFFMVLCYVFIFEKPYLKDFFGLVNPEQYFFWAVVLTAISIPIGNYFVRKWYQGNLLMQRVKGSKYYVWILIILISIILLSINKGWNLGIIISSIAGVLEILFMVYQIVKQENND